MTTLAQPFLGTGYSTSPDSNPCVEAENPKGKFEATLDMLAYSSSPRYGIYWIHGAVGTSGKIISHIVVGHSVVTPLITSQDVPQAVAEIRGQLGLNTTELADIIGVARQSIYEWVNGGTVKEVNRLKVSSLMEIAKEWRALCGAPMGLAVRELGEHSDLLALLKSEPLDRSAISATLGAIQEKIASREAAALPSAQELAVRYGLRESSREDYRRKLKSAARRAKRGL